MRTGHGLVSVLWSYLISSQVLSISTQNQSAFSRVLNDYDLISNQIIKPHLCAPRNVCKRLNDILDSQQHYIISRTKACIRSIRCSYGHYKCPIPDTIASTFILHNRIHCAYKYLFYHHGTNNSICSYLLYGISMDHLLYSDNQEDIKFIKDLKPNLYTKNTLSKLQLLHDTLPKNTNLYTKNTLSKLQLLHDTLPKNTNYTNMIHFWNAAHDAFSSLNNPQNEYWVNRSRALWKDLLVILRIKVYSNIVNDTTEMDHDWFHQFTWMRLWSVLRYISNSIHFKTLLYNIKMYLLSMRHLFNDLSIRPNKACLSGNIAPQWFKAYLLNVGLMGSNLTGFSKSYHESIRIQFKMLIKPMKIVSLSDDVNGVTSHITKAMIAMDRIDALLSYGIKLNIYAIGDPLFQLMNDFLMALKRFHAAFYHLNKADIEYNLRVLDHYMAHAPSDRLIAARTR
eukprot:407890_1